MSKFYENYRTGLLPELLSDCIDEESYKETNGATILTKILKDWKGEKAPYLLDVGCGSGQTYHLANQIRRGRIVWHGVDVIDFLAIEKTEDIRFDLFDGINIPLQSESVDIAYCAQVLEHVRHPDQLIREVYRVLKPGGLLVGSVSYLELYHAWSLFNFTPYAVKTVLLENQFSNCWMAPGPDMFTWTLRRMLPVKIYSIFSRISSLMFGNQTLINSLVTLLLRLIRKPFKKIAVYKLFIAAHICFVAKKE